GGITWTCAVTPVAAGNACPASGTGNISTSTVNLNSGATATFTVSSTVSGTATGTISNTASVAVPAGTTDSISGNNSATANTDVRTADLSISKTGPATVTAGGSISYTITVT